MNEKKAKLLRKQAKLKPLQPKQRWIYKLFGARKVDTGAGKSISIGGHLEVTGPKSLYKEMKKQFYINKKR